MNAGYLDHNEQERRRTWRNPDGVVCVHPYEPGEPSGYVAWHVWADRQRRRPRQRCATPGCPIVVFGIEVPS